MAWADYYYYYYYWVCISDDYDPQPKPRRYHSFSARIDIRVRTTCVYPIYVHYVRIIFSISIRFIFTKSNSKHVCAYVYNPCTIHPMSVSTIYRFVQHKVRVEKVLRTHNLYEQLSDKKFIAIYVYFWTVLCS